jgi:hypothetical protein
MLSLLTQIQKAFDEIHKMAVVRSEVPFCRFILLRLFYHVMYIASLFGFLYPFLQVSDRMCKWTVSSKPV